MHGNVCLQEINHENCINLKKNKTKQTPKKTNKKTPKPKPNRNNTKPPQTTTTKPTESSPETTDNHFPSDLIKYDLEHFKSSASFQFI